MIGKLVFCGLLALAVAVPTPAARRCEPPQWEALMLGRVGQVSNNQPQVFAVMANRSNDFTNKMMAIHEVVEIKMEDKPSTYVYISFVADYKTMMMYEFQPMEKTCKKTKLNDEMKLFCSDSDGATLSHSFMLDGKMVELYDVEAMVFGRKTMSHTSVFKDAFTPISQAIEQDYDGMPQLVVFQYGNVMAGIKDKNVFNIPSYCK